jgi:glutaconate CoA-transferase subunit B
MSHKKRAFVEKIDFVTSLGHGKGGDDRAKHGVTTAGPTKVLTDLCVMEPDPKTKELTVVSLHPGVTREQVIESTGWRIKFADKVAETPVPTAQELKVLRGLQARTKAAHGEAA